MEIEKLAFKTGDDIGIDLNYSFQSGLGFEGDEYFIKKVTVEMVASNFDSTLTAKVGEVSFYIIYLGEAINHQRNFYGVLDSYDQYVFDNGTKVIDTEHDEFNKNILEHYNHDLIEMTFCLFGSLTIHPEFRGQQLGAKLMKDVIFHYSTTCHLFVLKPFPLQFEGVENKEPNNSPYYEGLENNKEKATQKLINYYQKAGFEEIRGVEGLMFLNSTLKNSALDSIDLEEYFEYKSNKN